MNSKIIAFLLCGTLLLSAAGCGASGKQADANLSKPVEETAEEVDAAVMDEAGDKLRRLSKSRNLKHLHLKTQNPKRPHLTTLHQATKTMTLHMPSPMRNLTETRSSLFRMEK